MTSYSSRTLTGNWYEERAFEAKRSGVVGGADGTRYTRKNPKPYEPSIPLTDGPFREYTTTSGTAYTRRVWDEGRKANAKGAASTAARSRLVARSDVLRHLDARSASQAAATGALAAGLPGPGYSASAASAAEWKTASQAAYGSGADVPLFRPRLTVRNPYLARNPIVLADADVAHEPQRRRGKKHAPAAASASTSLFASSPPLSRRSPAPPPSAPPSHVAAGVDIDVAATAFAKPTVAAMERLPAEQFRVNRISTWMDYP